jgi:hypothetical protein
MAIEKRELGTQDNPDINVGGSAVEVFPEPTRQDQIREAAEILVTEEEILIGDEMDIQDTLPEQIPFDANLVEFVDENELQKLSNDILSSIRHDKQSRSEWEKTYVDGLKYLGMKFDEARSEPFEGSSGVIHPIGS